MLARGRSVTGVEGETTPRWISAEAIWDVYASSWLCVTGLGGESVKLGSGVGSVRKAVCQPGSYLLLPILGLCPRAIVFGHLDGFLDDIRDISIATCDFIAILHGLSFSSILNYPGE